MKKVGISASLERRLRALDATGYDKEIAEAISEVVGLLDKEDAKRAASSEAQTKPGLGYKELVALFRFHLGADLALPPSPSPAWIIRIVNKAREQGVNLDNVEQAIRGLRGNFRPPYSLDFIIFRYAEHFSRGVRDVSGPSVETKVYTGRGEAE